MNPQAVVTLILICLAVVSTDVSGRQGGIDRQAMVERHNPVVSKIDPWSPFTVGNGQFAFTADITGLQSLPGLYHENGIPLETKARWAWHNRANPNHYRLDDANVEYSAYGRIVSFPTDMDSAAGQWLRRNPHDLPLARIGLLLDGRVLNAAMLTDVHQRLDLWTGLLESRYTMVSEPVVAQTVAGGQRDIVAVSLASPLVEAGRLGISLDFPRGYKAEPKNTPRIDWGNDEEHATRLIERGDHHALFLRQVDDHRHLIRVGWEGNVALKQTGIHSYRLLASPHDAEVSQPTQDSLRFTAEFLPVEHGGGESPSYEQVKASSAFAWSRYWLEGAAIDFAGSRDPRAVEIERRIVLSQYLMGVQSRADIPAQETGLTSSSWYGKHHTEMAWWNTAHWIIWGRNENAARVLDWYLDTMDMARQVARSRGLEGVRWPKMVGPTGRESPGGNPLIIWNQPQVIHLAEMLYQSNPGEEVLRRYTKLVEESAQGLSSMLSWDQEKGRWSLEPPIWIAQEIYDPLVVRNPAFELSYWRYGLKTAQLWRKRLGRGENPEWNRQLASLADLPQSDGKYVAIESVPDTFANIESRQDHPTMLAPLGLLNDETVDPKIMNQTLHAVLESWQWEKKIWGWDYPMISMTAARLGQPELALEILLKEAPHNRYLANGHCPQQGAGLPVYLPANGAFLAAVAELLHFWESGGENGEWKIRVEGINPVN